MTNAIGKKKWSLSNLLDYFIPQDMQVDPAAHRRARMFMLSHVFGPVLGNTLPIYLYVMDICRDYRVSVFFASITAFWIYPFMLRQTRRYQLLAFISVQNLIFCAIWACYAFGGMLSPFLPWLLIFPLLAFLYLPSTGWVRNVLLVQIFGNVGAFFILLVSDYTLPYINMKDMEFIGLLSMASVAIYFAMMSHYFAGMFTDQRRFARELMSLVSSSDNIRDLTTSAQQASAAKANFVASMSHELRTPLNAIIGYSQLLIDEATDENDIHSLKDLQKVHKSGSDLLHLIDDILDYSRIDAGKMPVNPAIGNCNPHLDEWLLAANTTSGNVHRPISMADTSGIDTSIRTDWKALGQTFRHLAVAVALGNNDGEVQVAVEPAGNGGLVMTFIDRDPNGKVREPIALQENFEHENDASASKYGGTGIEIALALKFAHLIGGSIAHKSGPDGQATCLYIPANMGVVPLQQAA
jgi:signal transduction histidine kinase